jgi:hypothetical protein
MAVGSKNPTKPGGCVCQKFTFIAVFINKFTLKKLKKKLGGAPLMAMYGNTNKTLTLKLATKLQHSLELMVSK